MAEPEFETREAGALWGLYYALYHAPLQWWADNQHNLPEPVLRAFVEVQNIHRERIPGDFDRVMVGDSIDPLRYRRKEATNG